MELVAFSEFYNVQIEIFDSLGSGELIGRNSTAEGENIISLLFSGDLYDSLTPKTIKIILLYQNIRHQNFK